ncbi:MAG: hypothetical protein WDZ49_10275, partial [Litorilinea sp.]
ATAPPATAPPATAPPATASPVTAPPTSTSAEPVPPEPASQQPATSPIQTDVGAPIVQWDQARAYIGQTATVCGPVVAAQFAQQTNGQPTFLNVGLAFPAPERFQVVIWGNQRANFATPPEIAYRDASICVTGEIGEYRGTAEVTILGPAAIRIAAE